MTSSDLRYESVKPPRVFSSDAAVGTAADRLPTRVVLLGASNLTLGFPAVISRLHSGLDDRQAGNAGPPMAVWLAGGKQRASHNSRRPDAAASRDRQCRPLHVYAAHGHGRSFGSWSRVVVRALPGIVDCRLWHDLELATCRSPDSSQATSRQADAGGQARMLALLTDVGNDLLYGATVAQIAGWIETCLDRLRSYDADVTLTLLPMQSVERLSAWRYHMTKAIFFPGRNLGWNEMLARARALNDRLGDLARQYDARVVEPPGDWYGFDPIHIRRARREFAWQRILSAWPGFNAAAPPARMSAAAHCRLWLHAPAERRLLGIHRTQQQPTGRFEQIAVHLY